MAEPAGGLLDEHAALAGGLSGAAGERSPRSREGLLTQRLLFRQFFDVPRERLFRAWTEPSQMRRWFSPVGFTTAGVEADVRPGGRYRIGMSPPDGTVFFARGEYREVSSPDRLVFTWEWEGNPLAGPGETLVTVEFHESGSGTELRLMHELLPDDDARARHEHGWTSCLQHLRLVLADS